MYILYIVKLTRTLFFFYSGPQPDWDPDIVEGLDEDFDFNNPDNVLDDDFMLKANAPEDGRLVFIYSLVHSGT